MERSEFYNLITGIFKYLRFKELPTAAVIDGWHTDLNYMDSNGNVWPRSPTYIPKDRERENREREKEGH